MAVERRVPDGESDLTALIEPIGSIEPRKRPEFWPETTPVSGLTPRLPDPESE